MIKNKCIETVTLPSYMRSGIDSHTIQKNYLFEKSVAAMTSSIPMMMLWFAMVKAELLQ